MDSVELQNERLKTSSRAGWLPSTTSSGVCILEASRATVHDDELPGVAEMLDVSGAVVKRFSLSSPYKTAALNS